MIFLDMYPFERLAWNRSMRVSAVLITKIFSKEHQHCMSCHPKWAMAVHCIQRYHAINSWFEVRHKNIMHFTYSDNIFRCYSYPRHWLCRKIAWCDSGDNAHSMKCAKPVKCLDIVVYIIGQMLQEHIWGMRSNICTMMYSCTPFIHLNFRIRGGKPVQE